MAVTGIREKVLVQVCVIVRDVEQMAAHYKEIFGFETAWDFQITRMNDHTQATYYGKPTDARAKITGFQMGQVAFELLQPLDSPSTWMDHLEQHGEGIHHVAFYVPRTGPAAASFVDHGYHITQQGLFTERNGMYTYLDTERELGIVIELLEHYDGNPVPDSGVFPEDRGIGTDLVCQVGIIVNDIQQAAQRYCELLGSPAPRIFSTLGHEVTETTYFGQPSDATAALAFFDMGQVQLELIQPDAERSVWRDFLEAKGQGAQHIAFRVNDTKRVVERFAHYGISVAQQGLYGDRSGMYTYLNSDSLLGTTIELLESF